MDNTITDMVTRNIANSVCRTVQVTEWLEKNQIKKQAKLQVLRLVASDLAGTMFGDDEQARDEFIKACGLL